MTGAIPGSVALCGSAVTVTAISLVWPCWRTPNVPLRYSYRHWNTWFAFTPCSRATRAIDAPGTNVASTMGRFSSGVRRNRFREWVPLNCNRIAHKVIVGQIKPSVSTVKNGRLPAKSYSSLRMNEIRVVPEFVPDGRLSNSPTGSDCVIALIRYLKTNIYDWRREGELNPHEVAFDGF